MRAATKHGPKVGWTKPSATSFPFEEINWDLIPFYFRFDWVYDVEFGWLPFYWFPSRVDNYGSSESNPQPGAINAPNWNRHDQ